MENENFEVHIPVEVSKTKDGTVLITSTQDIQNEEIKVLASALTDYVENPKGSVSSVIGTDTSAVDDLDVDTINNLASTIHYTLDDLNSANRIILKYVTSDSLLGRCYEAIYSNINTDYKLDYPKILEEESDDMRDEIVSAIERMNDDINLEQLIRDSVSGTFLEGNYPMIMQLSNDYVYVDHYPMVLAYPSEYKMNGNRVLEFNVKQLSTLLKKTYKKTKKNKAIYEENLEKEVKNNYPNDVYKAYKDGENYCKLDPSITGCLQIGEMGKRFGVSPFFRCLKPLIVLNNIEAADVASSKSRSKKIIFQKLRKELMGTNYDKKGLAEQRLAHKDAANAINTNFSLYTAPPFVESLGYVVDESKVSDSDLVAFYNSKLLTGLGIGFTDTNVANYSVANISVDQLMRTINTISNQLERVLNRFYREFLKFNDIEEKFAPKITICDSELMSWELRQSLSQLLYSTFNASRNTSMKLLGVDVQEEKVLREQENEENLDNIFSARETAYTHSSKGASEEDKGGRPTSSDDEAKSDSDKDRYAKQ